MTETAAKIGYDSTYAIGNGADPEVFTVVAEVTSISPPGRTRDVSEATHLQSPNKYKEFIAGMSEGGEATITLNFVPAATDALVTAFEAETGNHQITFPNDVTLTFAGIVTSYEVGELSTDKMSATMTVKSTGKAVLGAAA